MAIEILAPAGSFESLQAAVRCGANAVYLGGKAFNARRNASNFSDEELCSAVDYCHKRNVKVYLTLNTLVSDSELPIAYDAIKSACEAGIDAFIVQDIGLAAIVRRVCSSVPLHASTQMSVQSIDGIRILEKLGFSRAVLPRELSEKEIAAISSQTDMELEYFVHGALCMCVSGQCLMSSVLGGRSGNRGLCAQPCRLPFGVNGKGGSNLSLKDLSLVDEISRLEKAGICSFKIEGRMKRPEYVAAAVTSCKNTVNGIRDEKLNSSLQAVFSRSGFTKGYFEGKLGKDMFGIRRKEDVEGASTVLSDLARLYEKENPLIPVDFSATIYPDAPMILTASALNKTVCVKGSTPQVALNRAVTAEEISERLAKCGGTQFYAKSVNVDCGEGLFVPAGELNALRRNALFELETEISEQEKALVSLYNNNIASHTVQNCQIHARFFNAKEIPDNLDGISRAIVPLETDGETVERLCKSGVEVAAEIPNAVFSNSDKYTNELLRLKSHGVSLAWVCTLDGIGIAQKAGLPFSGGLGLNVFNSVSLEEIASLGAKDTLLSCEVSLGQASHLGANIPRGIMAYGRIPLMLTRNCPIRNELSCAQCGGESVLVDRMSVEFPVRCKNGCSYILNSRPLWLGDRQSDIRNCDFTLLYFTTETKAEASETIRDFICEKSAKGDFTRGLYYKGVT
ncbi:MAG: U32 family peptidase [Clostridia bacterium]|nr:U32 family peptidase [Clostridia bacterium]